MTAHATLNNPLAVWQRGRAWRKLPYARGVWDGPRGQCEYLCDRDYSVIAYRATGGGWRRGQGESLQGFAMIEATYVWKPGIGESPAVNFATLSDLLKRCARHPSTAWLIEGVTA